ncbi:MAG: hypothetical protein AB1414_10600 [bacterium]
MTEKKYTEKDVELKIKQEIIGLYEELFKTLWDKIAVTLGGITLVALFRRIIRKVSLKYTWMKRVEVGEEGLDFKNLHCKMCEGDKEVMKEGFNTVIAELFSFLTQMTGDILIGELENIVEKYIPEMREELP